MTKYCNKCKETKSLTEFAKMTKAKDGLQSSCKSCHNAENRRISELRGLNGPSIQRDAKVCNKCLVRKPINQFYVKRKHSADGYGSYCKPCWSKIVQLNKLKASARKN